jgi:hypothetical protein
MSVHDNFLHECLYSIDERVMHVRKNGKLQRPPEPKPRVFRKLEEFQRKLIAIMKRKLPNLRPTTWAEFLALCPKDKLKRYKDAIAKLSGKSITRKISYINFFIKAEKTNFTRKPNAVPRAIQPRTPEYCALLGRYLKHLEHHYYDAVAEIFKEVTITKGLNADEVGALVARKFSKFSTPVAVGWDAERFDEHVHLDTLKWEHSLYWKLYSGPDRSELKRLLSYQLMNKGFAYTKDGYQVKYEVSGGRMSGDMNTALGNCLIMCAMVYYITKECGITRYELLNNGDDCVLILEESDLWKVRDFPRLFLDFGFSMKMEEAVREIEHIVFCQSHPVWVNGSYRMCRQVRTALCKDTTINSGRLSQKSFDEWRNAVALGGLSLCSRLPVFQDFYQWMGRDNATKRCNPHIGGLISSGFYRLAAGMKADVGSVDRRTRLSFYIGTGLTPNDQVALESKFKIGANTYNLGPVESEGFTHPQEAQRAVHTSAFYYRNSHLDYIKW